MTNSAILESAEMGATGRFSGNSISSAQHTGWRFQISQPLAIEQVGGHMLAIPDIAGDIHAALVRLPSPQLLAPRQSLRPRLVCS